jgi:RNA polymerase sigma-70 factor (ECF subfamily)
MAFTTTTIDDVILIARFQRGDQHAIETLIQRHQARAYQYAYRLTRSSDEASDVVSEAFVRVYRAIASFKGESAFSTWLHRIITNCFLDRRKKASARPTVSLESTLFIGGSEMERQFEDHAPTPHEEAERGERGNRLQRAMAKLPEYQRSIIILYHVDMLSYEEIAESLVLPMGTVKSRLKRARLAMRELLACEQEIFAYMA